MLTTIFRGSNMRRWARLCHVEKRMQQNLLDDMIVDILSRLRAKSLFRFRCVCRSWLALIIWLNKDHQKFFLLSDGHYSIFDCYEQSFDSDTNVAMLKVEPSVWEPALRSLLASSSCSILASCDCWLLLSDDYECKSLLLLNPYTREYKKFRSYRHPDHHNYSFGICYDCCDNDYKVILILKDYFKKRPEFIMRSAFTVFSFKTKSWSRIASLPSWVDKSYLGKMVSVKGAPHWICYVEYNPDDGSRYAIARFDLKDKFNRLPQPPAKLFSNTFWNLAVLRGNLCAYNLNELWEMKEYGVKESWSQVCRINSSLVPSARPWCTEMKPLGFTKKGELIVATSAKNLIIYNVEDGSFKTLATFDEERLWMRIEAYADGSISLNGDCLHNRGSMISISNQGHLFQRIYISLRERIRSTIGRRSN